MYINPGKCPCCGRESYWIPSATEQLDKQKHEKEMKEMIKKLKEEFEKNQNGNSI
jgi:hypothetical protein